MTTYQKRVKVPEPMREAPKIGTTYWTPDVKTPRWPDDWKWYGDRHNKAALKAGVCYRTKRDAIARAKAMLMMEEE